jgi:hypothetical protein
MMSRSQSDAAATSTIIRHGVLGIAVFSAAEFGADRDAYLGDFNIPRSLIAENVEWLQPNTSLLRFRYQTCASWPEIESYFSAEDIVHRVVADVSRESLSHLDSSL